MRLLFTPNRSNFITNYADYALLIHLLCEFTSEILILSRWIEWNLGTFFSWYLNLTFVLQWFCQYCFSNDCLVIFHFILKNVDVQSWNECSFTDIPRSIKIDQQQDSSMESGMVLSSQNSTNQLLLISNM